MGRSAKMMKRPTKAEKLSRQINTPAAPSRRERSLSPDLNPASGPSTIPLFNTSAKRKGASHPISGLGGQESLVPSGEKPRTDRERIEEMGMEVGEVVVEGKKKRGLKDKLKAAREQIREDAERSKAKIGGKGGQKKANVLGGVDYVALHEKGLGKRKFR